MSSLQFNLYVRESVCFIVNYIYETLILLEAKVPISWASYDWHSDRDGTLQGLLNLSENDSVNCILKLVTMRELESVL